MQTKRIWIYSGALALATALPALGVADEVRLERDEVIPAVMMTELNFKTTREGDRFKAEVNDSRMLPWGSRLEGVVHRVEQKRGDQPAYMDIEFTTVILPDGRRADFRGTPISLSKDYVTRGKDGRWEAKKGVKKDTVVLGSIAGGLVLGSLIKKPFEGAILGAILGVVVAETDKQRVSDGHVVMPKGSKVGVRVEDDFSVQFDGRWGGASRNDVDIYGPYDRDGYNKEGYDRYGYDKSGRYNERYDSSRNRRADGEFGRQDPVRDEYDPDGYNRDGFDKYGYNREGRYDPKHDTVKGRDLPRRTDREIEIEVDKKAMRFAEDEQPYRNGWVVMVPLESTADQLGFEVYKNRSGNQIKIENEDDVLTVEQDSKSCRLNGRRDSLPALVETKNGVIFVPIDAFTKLAKGSVYVNGTKYRPQT